MALMAMTGPEKQSKDIARKLGITTTTLYAYVNGDGSLKKASAKLRVNRPVSHPKLNSSPWTLYESFLARKKSFLITSIQIIFIA